MKSLTIKANSKTMTLLMGLLAVIFVFFIILYPDRAFHASLQGLTLWWKIVFPALLPFLIASEILIAYGFPQFAGVWLGPITRHLFRIPGIGGWALALGVTAGYPAGAEVTVKLRKLSLISRSEAERLLCFSHLATPVYISTVIAVGFFHNPALSAVILSVHYLSAILVGLLFRFHNAPEVNHHPFPAIRIHPKSDGHKSLLRRSLAEMTEARQQDGRSFGKLLGEAVLTAIQTLMSLGGYIMIFAVIVQMIRLTGITAGIQHHALLAPLFTGLFELNLGAYATSQSASVLSIIKQSAVIGFLLAWSGLAMHGQIKQMISTTDIRYSVFLLYRCLHALLAVILTFWLYQPLASLFSLMD